MEIAKLSTDFVSLLDFLVPAFLFLMSLVNPSKDIGNNGYGFVFRAEFECFLWNETTSQDRR
jgi:hypothetical protein